MKAERPLVSGARASQPVGPLVGPARHAARLDPASSLKAGRLTSLVRCQ